MVTSRSGVGQPNLPASGDVGTIYDDLAAADFARDPQPDGSGANTVLDRKRDHGDKVHSRRLDIRDV